MTEKSYTDEADVVRLRTYAARMEQLGKGNVATLWRDMAERLEAKTRPQVNLMRAAR